MAKRAFSKSDTREKALDYHGACRFGRVSPDMVSKATVGTRGGRAGRGSSQVTAVVSCRWDVARMVGAVLSEGRPIPTREAPEVDRVYFALPMRVGVGGVAPVINDTDVEVRYFWTQAEAYAWGEQDAERRLMGRPEETP